MPEIMAQNIFPSIKRDGDVPLLALVMDEQSGNTGFVTRLRSICRLNLIARKKRTRSLEDS